jgi:protein involved in polysaccharide export with SLBB domain
MRLRMTAIAVVVGAAFWTTPAVSVAPVLGARIVAQADQPGIFVVGNVNRPGRYPHKDGMNVEAALEAAGGLATKSAQETFIIARRVDGEVVRINATRKTTMNAADTLYIPVDR